ncbi:hypothetical protein OHW02_17340 [Acinetobacter baumannii]|nr:hypothetical protein [Acinetobacter baumannii]
MNKKELTEKVTGWILAITIYTVGVFYLLNKVLGITGDDLDALVSLLGVGATLFGGYMAIYLFTDWREQVKHEKSLTALIDVSATFAKLHRAIIRLKLEKKHTNFNKNYKNDDFIKTLMDMRTDFNDEVNKITVTFDELDYAIKTLYLASERKDTPFKSVIDEYFKITYVWKDIYLNLIIEVNDGHTKQTEYTKLIKEHLFQLYYIQVAYDPHENEYERHSEDPIFLSIGYLKKLRKEVNLVIEEFRKTL